VTLVILVVFFSGNSSLTSPDLSNLKLDNDDVVAICKAPKTNTTLMTFELEHNQIEDK
jgi:hypothetical protein